MTARPQRPKTQRAELIVGAILLVMAVLVELAALAYRLGGGTDPGWGPDVLVEAAAGRRTWPLAATFVLIAELGVLTAAVFAVAIVAGRRAAARGPRRPVDDAAKTMTDPGTVEILDETKSSAQAERLAPGLNPDHPFYRGLLMGHTVRGHLPVHIPWEWVVVAIAGTRMGKTAALAIPAVCGAPGPCIATSNKPDIFTSTHMVRRDVGRIWLFDLQGVTSGRPGQAAFWWNPLKQVFDLPSAKKAAAYFVGASKEDGARAADAYFDGSAQDLLSAYMLASALAGGDMIHAVEWMAQDQSTVAASILRAHGEHAVARMLSTKQEVTERQRDGYYDMARRFLESLDAQRYARVILPPRRTTIAVTPSGSITTGLAAETLHALPEFDPQAFVTSSDTLYALSKEGPDSASALTTALVGQVLDAAESAGARTKAGRLDIPMVAVLDEASNCCKLQSLPDQYSHFGSRGIVVITIFQSPAQGRNLWGPERWQTMLDAASAIWYGGNVSDKPFLDFLSELIDDHWVQNVSTSTPTGFLAQGNASRSTDWRAERILKVSDLAALTSDRAIFTLPGAKPLLLRKAFAYSGPFGDGIRASIDTPAPELAAATPPSLTKEPA